MASVSVRITQLLADIGGTGRTTTVTATTAAEAVDALCARVPALRVHVFDNDGDVRRHVNIFVRGEIAKGPGSLDVAVADGDEVAVVPAVSGGRGLWPASPPVEPGPLRATSKRRVRRAGGD